MIGRSLRRRQQRTTIVHGMLAFAALIVTLQLWLLSASLNAFLGGDGSVVVPAAIASVGCLGLNLGLLRYLYQLD